MAGGTKVRGITIELGADTNGISKALGSLNSEIKDTSKQLKDVEKLLKLDPKNTELLRQKQELLNKALDTSKTKVGELEKAQAELGERTEKNASQYDAIEREIIACKQEQANWQKELDEMQPKVKTLKDTLSDISEATGKAAEKTKVLSAAAAGAGAALLGNAMKSAAAADDLATLAAQTGLTVEEIQKMQYASNLVDVSTDDMIGSLKKLTSQMSKDADVFDTLGVSIYDSNGEMRNATDVWYEALGALSKIENETERDALSMELFGKNASSLTGIIDDGGEAMKALGQEAEDLGLIMSGDAVNSAVEFNNQMDLMKQRTSMAFMEMGSSLATTLVPALEKLVGVVTQVVTWFSDLDGTTQLVILSVLGLVAAISPVLSLISLVTGAAAALNVAVLPMIGTIALVVAGIAAAIAIGVALYKNWDTIKEKANELWTTITEAFNNMLTTISETMTNIKDAIVEGWEEAIKFIKELPSKAIDWGKDIIDGMIQGIRDKIGGIGEAVGGIADKIKGFIGFSEPEEGPLSNFHTYMPDMMEMMAEGIKDNTWRVEQAITGVAGTIQAETAPADYSSITGRLDSLIGATGNQQVNVVLQGDAAGVFKLVRTQNTKFKGSTGRSAFDY